jgi:stage II sporulation protein D
LAIVGWRRAVSPLALACTLALAATSSAQGARLLIIDGAGDGHGVGMSQTGAAGYALHGWSAQQILAHYYTGTEIGRIAPGHVVSVLLQSGARRVLFSGATRAGDRTLDPAANYELTNGSSGTITLEGAHHRHLAELAPPLHITGSGPLTLRGRAENGILDGRYRGGLDIVVGRHGLRVINELGIEAYLRGVVPSESPSSWPAAELEAQAIAARSYAITSGSHGPFDLYSDVRSQQYDGVAAETPPTNAAVAATRDEIVTYAGAPITTFYFASSGGETEDVQNVFAGATPEPYLQAVADPYDHSRYGPMALTLATADHRLRGLVEGRLEAIRVLRRGVSPRILTADIVGTRGTTTVSGAQLEAALHLHSTWACFTVTPPSGKATAGWDAACRRPSGKRTGSTGPTGPAGPTGPTGATNGGAVAPSGSSGASGTT